MKNNKPKLITIVLILMIFFLFGSIFYITKVITSEQGTETASLAPKKTKAANLTYSKLIALNTVSVTPTMELVTPTTEPSSTIGQISPTKIISPSPTEIILALDNSKNSSSQAAQISTSISPTKATSLPETGFINNSLILFAAASILILFSFIF